MSAVRLEAKCPGCGVVREVKPVGDGYAMKKHTRGTGYFSRFNCDGGTVAAEEVLKWAMSARAEKASIVESFDADREKARAALTAELARLDAQEAEYRNRVAAYDRAIAKIEKKVTP
jgi:hypothetical protein